MGDVVAITHVGKLETPKRTEFFLEGEDVRESLAGMEFVRERIDDGDRDVFGHFIEDALFVDSSDNALDPTLKIARDVRNGFPFTKPCLGMIQENDEAAHALHADFKRDAGAKRRLLENQGDVLVTENAGVARGARLNVRGALKQVAGVRRRPFGAGQQVRSE